jgi:uncharacterized cupin superfamily protein
MKKGLYTPTIFPKVWGEEHWIANCSLYCGKILHLRKGYRCSIHWHDEKDETFYILRGLVLLEIGGDSFTMQEGDTIRVYPGVAHRFTGLQPSQILEISTQHKEADSCRLTQSEKCSWFKRTIVDRWRKLRRKTTNNNNNE